MSEETYTEVTGNIVVHHPIRREPWVRAMNEAWDDLLQSRQESTMTEAELRRIFDIDNFDNTAGGWTPFPSNCATCDGGGCGDCV